MNTAVWAALLVAIAGAAAGALLNTRWRKPLAATAAVLLGAAVVLAVLASGGEPRLTTSGNPSPSPVPTGDSPQPTTPDETPQPGQAMTAVPLRMDNGLEATLYFGQLEHVLRELDGHVTFRTISTTRAEHPQLCVMTAVVGGASGEQGAVYALGSFVDDGWGAAEDPPDLNVATDDGTLHQQLIVPPASATPGDEWTGSAHVEVDTVSTTSSEYHVALEATEDSLMRWLVGDSTVECEAAP